MAVPVRACAYHSDRSGHAVCMVCRKGVCRECATEWDGINHCVDCLFDGPLFDVIDAARKINA